MHDTIKQSALLELRSILHDEDECHPGLTCLDEIIDQHNALLNALREVVAQLSGPPVDSPEFIVRGVQYPQYILSVARQAIAKAES